MMNGKPGMLLPHSSFIIHRSSFIVHRSSGPKAESRKLVAADDTAWPFRAERQSGGKSMQAGKSGSSWWARRRRPAWCGPAVWLGLVTGCAAPGPHLDQAIFADNSPARRTELVEHYQIGCPDVLNTTVAGRPELSGPRRVGADGRIDLGTLGRLRVEGKTAAAAAQAIAERCGAPPGQVRVRVAEYNSQQVYLTGEVNGLKRAVAYQGPERTVELLQRAGGLTTGAAVGDVKVLRSHVIDGRAPEVFTVDLQAIVTNHDSATDVVIQPFDQIYVGESRQSSLQRCIPPLLLPLYRMICGLERPAP
jgi:protein involved in polysaccharide export with SLBB domain